jgi:GWxTD domain-containing protein
MFKGKTTSVFLCVVFFVSLAFSINAEEECLYPYYQKKKKSKDWINGAVRYITTTEEKKQYNKLKTEEEKERFIKWFWAQRDPSPDTYKNEFQEEFEQRVQFADKNFREVKLNGWETARGHVYIVLGPPSSINKRVGELSPARQIKRDELLFWYYEAPLSRYLTGMQPLVFTEYFKDGRWILLPPIPRDAFGINYQRMRQPSYFEQVADEYLRAFEQVNKGSIRSHDLKMEYLVDKEKVEKAVEAEELPFQWKADFVPLADGKIEVNLILVLQYKEISYYQKETNYKADIDILVELYKIEGNKPEAELKDEINIELTEQELLAKAKENLEYKGFLVVLPGEYTIKIIAKDRRTHSSKTVTEQLIVDRKTE